MALQWNIFTQSGAVRSVGWIFIVGAPDWLCFGKYVTLDRTFYSLLLKQEAVAAQLLPQFVLIAFLEVAFIRNTVIILCINCIITVFINNYAVINNNLWKTLRTYFSLQNSTGMRKNFFKICRQFGRASSQSFASSGLLRSNALRCCDASNNSSAHEEVFMTFKIVDFWKTHNSGCKVKAAFFASMATVHRTFVRHCCRSL